MAVLATMGVPARFSWTRLVMLLLGLLLVASPALFQSARAEDAADVEVDVDVEEEAGVVDEDAPSASEQQEQQEQQRQVFVHPLTNMPPELDGVETYYHFPTRGDLAFPAGAPVEVLLGVHNGAERDVNVSFVMGSLNSPFEFGLHVQNFTGASYGVVVEEDDEATFSYTFTPDRMLRPTDFITALTVFYTIVPKESDEEGAGERFYSTTFYNGTCEIVEPEGLDTELIFMTLTFAGLIGGALVLAAQHTTIGSKLVSRATKSSKSDKEKAKTTRSAEEIRNEWLQGTAADTGARATRRRTPVKTRPKK